MHLVITCQSEWLPTIINIGALFEYTVLFGVVAYVTYDAYNEKPVSMDDTEQLLMTNVPDALSQINTTFDSKYSSAFAAADISVQHLPRLSVDYLVQYLNVSLGDALDMVEGFKDLKTSNLRASIQSPTNAVGISMGPL